MFCETRLGVDGRVQLLQYPADDDDPAQLDVRFQRSASSEWEDGWAAVEWPVVHPDGSKAWAFDALSLGAHGPVIVFGCADVASGCSVEIGDLVLAVGGPLLMVVENAVKIRFITPHVTSLIEPRT